MSMLGLADDGFLVTVQGLEIARPPFSLNNKHIAIVITSNNTFFLAHLK